MQNDPLSNLRDIHLPEPGGFWPPAPGWWLLAVLALAGVIALGLWLYRRHRANRWLKQARQEIDRLARSQQGDHQRLVELNRLLKRAARRRYPERHPESLSGDAWVAFLRDTTPARGQELEPVFRALVESSWRPRAELTFEDAERACRQWLRGQKC
ncbi:MAG: DUF4381 domain-containing protein [Marinobacter sp.]|uniref:DUF4381 domain-containing protein n=1 Tax=Marinobacter sp. TaxID=50741 RepID=UPI00299EB538|nr:DUF4381 domain-containing protein [Marinobacter sp.]MDX1636041.1 DUF4381 domain-containing protein [Marinobacter sp.]